MGTGKRGAAHRDPGTIRKRIEQARQAIGRAGEADPARQRAVLEERARRLADPKATPAWGRTLDLLRFVIAGEGYALEPRWVREVFRPASLARLPRAKPPAIALTGWRGQILPVLDLPQILGLPQRPLPEKPFALLLGSERPLFVLLVPALPHPLSILSASLREPPAGVAIPRELLHGMTADADLVLRGEEILRRHG